MQYPIRRIRRVGTGLGLSFAAISVFAVVDIGNTCFGGIAAKLVQSQDQLPVDNALQTGVTAPQGSTSTPGDRIKVNDAQRPLRMLIGVVVLIALTLDLTGRVLCLAVPSECQGAQALHASLAIIGTAILLQFVPIANLFGLAQGFSTLSLPFTMAAMMAAQILYMVFLRQLGEYVQRDDLAQRARTILVWSIVVGSAYGACIAFLAAGMVLSIRPLAVFGMIGILLMAIPVYILIFLYAKLLINMRVGITEFADACSAPNGGRVEASRGSQSN